MTEGPILNETAEWFIGELLKTLNQPKNLKKTHWNDIPDSRLVLEIQGEAHEVHKAFWKGEGPERIIQECCDVAAFAMFLADNVRQNQEVLGMWKNYRKTAIQPMRPYVPGEDMSVVSVSKENTPEEGGMIARNPENHADQWYVAKGFFSKNYEEV